MAYLHSLAAEKGTKKYKIPMSYTALAQYLSVDRSAMMREIKNLMEMGVLRKRRTECGAAEVKRCFVVCFFIDENVRGLHYQILEV